METLGSRGLKRVSWEESEHDKNCQGGDYHYGRKEPLSESPCEGKLIEGSPMSYQDLIPGHLWKYE